MKAVVCEKTIAYGKNRYRVSSNGNWKVLMWGCWPHGNGIPSYKWAGIPAEKVPKVVQSALDKPMKLRKRKNE